MRGITSRSATLQTTRLVALFSEMAAGSYPQAAWRHSQAGCKVGNTNFRGIRLVLYFERPGELPTRRLEDTASSHLGGPETDGLVVGSGESQFDTRYRMYPNQGDFSFLAYCQTLWKLGARSWRSLMNLLDPLTTNRTGDGVKAGLKVA
ncbi:hypothetical protein E2C01_075686 [Portunus trituberculatus]|uniref:Uncharacterized protein n=1 Tax=Portunus trituberculatus TaxID=210409 RepID=A0A5B7IFP5_PORTR|nr:hypothetical protein [Portunus trituberculatus]